MEEKEKWDDMRWDDNRSAEVRLGGSNINSHMKLKQLFTTN